MLEHPLADKKTINMIVPAKDKNQNCFNIAAQTGSKGGGNVTIFSFTVKWKFKNSPGLIPFPLSL